MASWNEIEQAEPEFVRRVQQLFAAGRHKTIATRARRRSPVAPSVAVTSLDATATKLVIAWWP